MCDDIYHVCHTYIYITHMYIYHTYIIYVYINVGDGLWLVEKVRNPQFNNKMIYTCTKSLIRNRFKEKNDSHFYQSYGQ